MTSTQLKLIRLYLGLTQKDFATYVNVAESTIAKIEAGFTGVSDVTKARVYRKFDITEPGFITFCGLMEANTKEEAN
ncbi:hypothetical protein GCM10008934_16330 [Virgibacillus salarius]|uniref:helix-turn-helix transcriptional regulator n=1 Tax=Virgibacillus salarius TaxID=447199 RepID=UPI0031E455C0